MSDAITQARDDLRAEQAELQQQLTQIEQALAALDGIAPPAPTAPAAPRRSSAGRAPRGALLQSILTTLEGQGRQAVHADALLELLRETGNLPNGRHPKANLVNALTRLEKQGKVRNIGRNRWRRT